MKCPACWSSADTQLLVQIIERGGSAEPRAAGGDESSMSGPGDPQPCEARSLEGSVGAEPYGLESQQAPDSPGQATSRHPALDGRQDCWGMSMRKEEQGQPDCAPTECMDQEESQLHAEPACPRAPPAHTLADWWHEGRDSTDYAAAAAALNVWLCDYFCGTADAEASARCLAMLEASAQRTAAREAARAEQLRSLQPAQRHSQMQAVGDSREGPAEPGTGSNQRQGTPAIGGRAPTESIRGRRLREDLERRAAEEAAELAYRFRANPLPRSTNEPRCPPSFAGQHGWITLSTLRVHKPIAHLHPGPMLS